MKIEQIALQLANILPKHTDLFTDNTEIISLTSSAGTATAITSVDHGLATGDSVNMSKVDGPIEIDTIIRIDNIATVTTLQDHDLTQRYSAFSIGARVSQAFIIGADQSEYNGLVNVLSVNNRREFTYEVIGAPATPATGTITVIDGKNRGYSGLKSITVTDTDTFTYPIATDAPSFAQSMSVMSARALPRISGVSDFNRAVQSYTKIGQDKFWAFIDITSTISSKDRNILNDAGNNFSPGDDFRVRLIKNFSVYVFAPATHTISGRSVKDKMMDVEVALYKSLLGAKFESAFESQERFGVVPVSNQTIQYDTARYMHDFAFQASFDITFGDTIGGDENVAFRDVNHDFNIDMFNAINLDDIPL